MFNLFTAKICGNKTLIFNELVSCTVHAYLTFKCTTPLDPTEVEKTVGSTIYRYVKDYDGYLFNDCYYSFYMIFKDPEISDTPNDKTN